MFRNLCSVFCVLMLIACSNTADVSDGGIESDGAVEEMSEESAAAALSSLTFEDGIVRQTIDIPVGSDRVIHTEVVARGRTLLRRPANRRLVIMVPGTLANGAGYYDIASGTGYNAAEVLANAGNYIVILPDLPGTGESYRPADGSMIDAATAANAIRQVATFYRVLFLVNRVDIYGETGVGTNVGLLLARENWVRSFSASATFYRVFGPVTAPNLFFPPFRAAIASIPGGYAPQDPGFIAQFFGAADPVIQAQAVTACVGPAPMTTPTGAFIELFDIDFTPSPLPFPPPFDVQFTLDMPIVDAAPARAPALFIQGSPDFLGSEAGTAEMAAAYGTTGGGSATVVTLPGASHLMRFDVGVSDGPTSPFWAAELAFLAAH